MTELRFGILTISDRSARGEREDAGGPALAVRVHELGWRVTQARIVPDESQAIQFVLAEWSDSGLVDVILTTGGTGFSSRDVTPEATAAVIERLAPGIAEAIRAESLKITPHAMLSRGLSGIRGQTLIINLPGSPRGAVQSLDICVPVLSHAVELLRGDPGAEAGHRA